MKDYAYFKSPFLQKDNALVLKTCFILAQKFPPIFLLTIIVLERRILD